MIASALLKAVPPPLRRPAGLVEQTRWLFLMFLFGEVALVLPVPLREGVAARTLLALGSTAVLVSSWIYRYLRQSTAWQLDVVDALGVLGFGLSSQRPSIAIGTVMSAMWLRAMYGSFRRLLLYCLGSAAGLAAVFPLWTVLWDDPVPPAVYSLAPIPVTFLVTVVSRHLAMNLFAREQSQGRDATLGVLGSELLSVTDRASIFELANDCVHSLVRWSPGLGIIVTTGNALDDRTGARDGDLRVVETVGSCGTVPETLPRFLVPDMAHIGGAAIPMPAAHAFFGGATGRWTGVPLPEQPGAWLFVSHPNDAQDDALRAILSMVSLVTLGLRNSTSRDHLATQAHTDPLTGLANRSAFGSALEAALTHATGELRPAVIFLDLDDFKTVNDTLGHASGDELLRAVADRLRKATRSLDVCARLGGDEFGVLLSGATDEVAMVVAQRLVDVVATPFTLNGRTATIGASVGLVYVEPGSSAEELLRHADTAMYAAKAKGKNRVQTFDALAS